MSGPWLKKLQSILANNYSVGIVFQVSPSNRETMQFSTLACINLPEGSRTRFFLNMSKTLDILRGGVIERLCRRLEDLYKNLSE